MLNNTKSFTNNYKRNNYSNLNKLKIEKL